MSELNFNALREQTKKKIEALAARNGWSLEQAIDAIGIEFVAMGGVTGMKKAKAQLVQIDAKTAPERASIGSANEKP